MWQQASPDLPPEIEPYSFLSVDLLGHLADALALSPGMTLVDLGCGRGGPALWLARSHGAVLVGVDFSAVAVQQATERTALFGLADQHGSSWGTWPPPACLMPPPTLLSGSMRCTLPLIPPQQPKRRCACCGLVVGSR